MEAGEGEGEEEGGGEVEVVVVVAGVVGVPGIGACKNEENAPEDQRVSDVVWPVSYRATHGRRQRMAVKNTSTRPGC